MKTLKIKLGSYSYAVAHPMTPLKGKVYEVTGIPASVPTARALRMIGQSIQFHCRICRGDRSMYWGDIIS